MRCTFVSGDMREEFEVPDANLVRYERPRRDAAVPYAPREEVRRALDAPIGSPSLESLVSPASNVSILVDDATRPTPTSLLLPIVLERLASRGVPDSRIRITVANGLHRRPTPEETAELLGEGIPGRFDVGANDPDDDGAYVFLGATSRGTPLHVNRRAAEADLVVALGCVKAHSFAGFTGGAKSILPGVCSRRTVLANHRFDFTSYPQAVLADAERCEARLDMEEAAGKLPLFILNVVLDEEGRIAKAAAGGFVAAHRAAVETYRALSTVRTEGQADVALLGGSHGSRLTLYSTIVGYDTVLATRRPAVRTGGMAVAFAQCRHGVGSKALESLLTGFPSPRALLDHMRASDPVEAQWTAQRLAQYSGTFELGIVSSGLDPATAERLGFKPYRSMREALERALGRYGAKARVLVADRPDFDVVQAGG